MKNRIKLIDTLVINNDNIYDSERSVFKYLYYLNSLPFLNEDMADILTSDYYFQHSGNKTISLLYERILNIYSQYNEDTKYEKTLNNLANIIYNRFGNNWIKIYNAYFNTDYKPLENYSMIESETEESGTEESGKQATNSNITSASTANNINKFYGFGGNNAVNDSNNDTTTTTTDSGSKNDNYTDTNNSVETSRDRTLTRSGNIGVTTSQQMLESELKLRQYDFFNIMMNDVDKILCSKIYAF